jgi:DNA helicase HerA-like ATPase
MADPLIVARAANTDLAMLPALANRHGCITGATGTGKTVTLQVLAEQFSRIGVPVFMADVKGDLTGIAKPGTLSDRMKARLAALNLGEPSWQACPVTLWDVWGQQGHPIRATVSDLGPLLMARLLNLNDTQEGVLALTYKVADDNGLLLLDLKDLRALLQFVGDNAGKFRTQYGNISSASIGAIQRGLLQIEAQGGETFFGEPMLNIDDLIQTIDGRGVVNILAADRLMNSPRVYGSFLLWLLSELFEKLPEVGDLDKPKLVFFFDEAHLLFTDAPRAMLDKVEQVVRLIRSKGVGVYFVTQNPLDIPDKVLAQLGNRVQHALRAFTPRDQKAVKAAAETMRPNPALDINKAILELAVGEALISFLDPKGTPSVTQRAFVMPPCSQIGPISAPDRQALLAGSIVAGIYETSVDRESAFELLRDRAGGGQALPRGAQATPAPVAPEPKQSQPSAPSNVWEPGEPGSVPQTPLPPFAENWGSGQPGTQNAPASSGGGMLGGLSDILFGTTGPRGGRHEGVIDSLARSAARSVGSGVGRELVRGVLGSLLGGSRRR